MALEAVMSHIMTGRDPFARQSMRRRRGFNSTGCYWCGNVEKRLWAYYVERDDGVVGVVAQGRAFCDVKCLRAYIS